tara:strand:- start:1850 stop:2530 length:681 start_codon:yes stop_codon:yes gene_type:complete
MKWIKAAVTMRIDSAQSYHEIRDSLSHDLVDFLVNQGILPYLIPNNLNMMENICGDFDILILSGGNDVKLDNVEEQNTDELISAIINRNKMELHLIESFLQSSKPIFGICHGLQIINQYFGGTLRKVKSRDTHVSNEHVIRLESPEAQFLFGSKTMEVNSFHNYTIDNVGNSLNIDAVSLDGEVEMLSNIKKKVYGFMWHPERFFSDNNFMKINQSVIKKILNKHL